VADLKGYIRQIEAEYKDLTNKSIWMEYQRFIKAIRKKAGRRCETEENVKSWQGEVRAYKDVLDIIQSPDRLISFIKEKHG